MHSFLGKIHDSPRNRGTLNGTCFDRFGSAMENVKAPDFQASSRRIGAEEKAFIDHGELSALEAKSRAQWIALAPFVFQAALALRDLGILDAVKGAGLEGLAATAAAARSGLSRYGARILLEAGLGAGLLRSVGDHFVLTRMGFFLLEDQMTRVNMNFSQNVCYHGLFHLQEAVRSGLPEGLKVFGDWPTIYEGLSSLPAKARESWLDFDHFYSDQAFGEALVELAKRPPGALLDVGGNTGRFSVLAAHRLPDTMVTILDLPQQLEMASGTLRREGLENRVFLHPIDLLDPARPFPAGADAVWISQVLDCFAEDQVVSILERGRASLNSGGVVYVLEPCWDAQTFEASAFCLQMTSLYFTAMANGRSGFFRSGDLIRHAERAGLRLEGRTDGLGLGHTLFRFRAV